MGLLTPEIRECIVKVYRQEYKVEEITGIFGVSRYTVWYWVKRTYHTGRKNFRDRSRKPYTIHRKITLNIEDVIIVLRDSLNWDTQQIRVALLSPSTICKVSFGNDSWKNFERDHHQIRYQQHFEKTWEKWFTISEKQT